MHRADAKPPNPTPIDDATSPAIDARPGVLQGHVTLKLETNQAQRLVQGRPGNAGRPAIVGLIGFAALLRAIWHGARADDPYADWWLVRVHDALETTDQALQASLAAVQHELTATAAMGVTTASSVRPIQVPLRFGNPYAFRGARLLSVYDTVVRHLLTAQYVGLLSRRDAERHLAWCGRALRRAFLSPVGYRPTGVTRADVAQATARDAQARACLGEVPADILSGHRRAPHAPRPILPVPSPVIRSGPQLPPPTAGHDDA